MKIKKLKIKINNQSKKNYFLFRVFNISKSKRKEKKPFILKIKKKNLYYKAI